MDLLLRPAVLVPAVALIGFVVHQLFFAGPKLPKLPIVGARKGDWFPFWQAKWRNTLDFKSAVKLADEKYRHQAVLLPLIGSPNLVMVPRSEIQWVTDQPDSVLDMHAQAEDTLQTNFTVSDPKLVHVPVHHKLITTTLTAQIGNLVPDVADETAFAFERLAAYDARHGDPEKNKSGSQDPEPNDFLQWSIHQAKASGDPYMWKATTLAGRILLLNFAAIHTSSFSITNAILDLAASKQEYIDELRAEIEGVLTEHGGEWNKRALAKMQKLDSVMRESARLNSFVSVGLNRFVLAKDGIVTPSGVKIPHGATVVVPSYPVFHDADVYPDPNEFKPFRFAEQRNDENVEYIKRAAKAFASTSTDYLAFGHGRNACPGRFFAANELKLMLAHLILNYDIEIQGSRPPNMWFGLNRVPPLKASIRVKKRATP